VRCVGVRVRTERGAVIIANEEKTIAQELAKAYPLRIPLADGKHADCLALNTAAPSLRSEVPLSFAPFGAGAPV
jgi:hypothetical protein